MHRLRLIVIFLLSSIKMFSQFSGTVKEGDLLSTDLSINLFENKKYLIGLEYYSDGDIESYMFSMGNYFYVKDTLILSDVYYKYNLTFLRKKNELFPIKVFPWMKKTKYTSYAGSEFKDDYNIYSDDIFSYYKPLVYKNSHKKHRLLYRKYELGEYSLELIRENNYICKIDNFVVSEGKFSYNGNCITFYNKYPVFSFKGIVDEYSICLAFMPFKNMCFSR